MIFLTWFKKLLNVITNKYVPAEVFEDSRTV